MPNSVKTGAKWRKRIVPHDDVILNKASIVERCIRRIRAEYEADAGMTNPTHVDALTLNIERACQACIDMAMHEVAAHHLGVPQTSGEAFELLARAKIIDDVLAQALKGMTGFRNVAIHQYQDLDEKVLQWIVDAGWKDWVRLCEILGARIQP